MKKLFTLGLIALTTLTLASCTNKKDTGEQSTQNNASNVQKSKEISLADIVYSKKPILAFSLHADDVAYNKAPDDIYVFQNGKIKIYNTYFVRNTMQFKNLLSLSDEKILEKLEKEQKKYYKENVKQYKKTIAEYSTYKNAQEFIDNTSDDDSQDGLDEEVRFEDLSEEVKQQLTDQFNTNVKTNLAILNEYLPTLNKPEYIKNAKVNEIIVAADSTGNTSVSEELNILKKYKEPKQWDSFYNFKAFFYPPSSLLYENLDKAHLIDSNTIISRKEESEIEIYPIGNQEFTILDTKLKGYATDDDYSDLLLFRVDKNSNINYVLDKVSDDRIKLDD